MPPSSILHHNLIFSTGTLLVSVCVPAVCQRGILGISPGVSTGTVLERGTATRTTADGLVNWTYWTLY